MKYSVSLSVLLGYSIWVHLTKVPPILRSKPFKNLKKKGADIQIIQNSSRVYSSWIEESHVNA
jgi:hypothetical protein